MRTHNARAAALSVAVVATACALVAAAAAPGAAFTVTSALAGKTALPHRVHWLGIPSLPESKIREVDFLIDGKLAWVERHRPYSYGYDANYLVTTWLRPGMHRFTVTAVASDGSRASTSSTARTSAAAPPPARLEGSWSRVVTAAEAGDSGRPGRWTLTIDAVGWRILDPSRHGALVDVAYLGAGRLEARGGIATRNHDAREGNVWCDEPFQPVRYRWAASGDTLALSLAGPKRCDGESDVWAGSWTRGG